MVIRADQMSALHASAAKSFEERMVVHLRKCFPAECVSIGERGLREMIRYGTKRAAAHEITLERDVCKYIDVMMVFGSDFDTRSDLPWAAKILNDRVLRTPTARVERLLQEAKKH